MRLFNFELKKLSASLSWFIMLLLPVLLIVSTKIYHENQPDTYKEEQTRLANQLLSDIAWKRISYDDKRGDGFYGDYDPEVEDTLTEEEQEIFSILFETEKNRFQYSTGVFYEDWQKVNANKEEIWQNLMALTELGIPLITTTYEELAEELPTISWLKNNEIDYIREEHPTESLLILNSLSPYLFSFLVILIMIFLFALPILEDLHQGRIQFTRILPVSLAKIYRTKFSLLLAIVISYILVILLTTLSLNLLTDSLPLEVQLTYPIAYFREGQTILKPLWQVLTFQFIIFIFMVILMGMVTYLLQRRLKNNILSLAIVAFIVLLGQLSMRILGVNSIFNFFAWVDIYRFIVEHTVLQLFIVIGLILGLLLILIIFLSKFEPKGQIQTQSDSLSSYRLNLPQFEWRKLKGNKSLLYLSILMVLLGLYAGLTSFEKRQANLNQLNNHVEQIAQHYGDINASMEEHIQALNDSQDGQYYQDQIDYLGEVVNKHQVTYDFAVRIKGEPIGSQAYNEVSQEFEAYIIQTDYEYLKFPDSQPYAYFVPINDMIFYPNMAINQKLMEWKIDHGIDFSPPGGPYRTKFIPSYTETPRSGEFEPPADVDIEVFEFYLDNVSKDHHHLTGANLSIDFFNEYYYLAFLMALMIFLGPLYVNEFDLNKTIDFMSVLPVKHWKIHQVKRHLSLSLSMIMLILIIGVFFLVGGLLNGWGQLEFPFVQYIPKTVGEASPEIYKRISGINQYFQILPLWQYGLMALGLLAAVIYFINNLTYFIASFVKNKWILYGLVTGVLGIGYYLSSQYIGAWMAFNPFTYFNVPDIISGSTAIDHDFVYLTWWMGMMVNIVVAILLALISRWYLKKYRN